MAKIHKKYDAGRILSYGNFDLLTIRIACVHAKMSLKDFGVLTVGKEGCKNLLLTVNI